MTRVRTVAVTAATAALVATALLGCPDAASASASQPGPTQVLNDQNSSGTALIADNAGHRFRLKRLGYALHNSDAQFFTSFYVPRGTTVRFYATDPTGVPIAGLLQQETKAGWHQTNDKVDDADLVMITLVSRAAAV